MTDLSILSVTNLGTGANTILDERTSSTSPLTDTHVAMYVLGKTTSAGYYSRFSTSVKAATWAAGTSTPSTGACAPGSLYSNTNSTGTGAGALYVCTYQSGQTNWHQVPFLQ